MRQTVRIVVFPLLLVSLVSAGLGQHALTPNLVQPPSRKESVETITRLQEQAAEGNAQAQYSLGMAYITGTEIPRDYHQAVRWHQTAAAQGLADAQFALAYLYEEGEG